MANVLSGPGLAYQSWGKWYNNKRQQKYRTESLLLNRRPILAQKENKIGDNSLQHYKPIDLVKNIKK